MKKVFLFINNVWPTGDVVSCAMCEDGHVLANHLSSSIGFAKLDMGLTSLNKHEAYQKHCPDGFELEWVDDVENHEGLKKAYQNNQKLEL